jgi:hypothetical protein
MKPTKIKSFTHLIAAHPVQQAIIDMAEGKALDDLSLREIGERVGAPKVSPQQIKHHLSQLVRYGFLDIVGGKYRIGATLRGSNTRAPR